ncbi:MAG TPA: CoA-disulfide reductase, partial [Planctomycetaceae bacterium]|nr:CoA-disulfide reductase [Planctomycetaceae bacterium]
RDSRYRGTQGTSVVGAFGRTVAMTGLSEKALQRLGRPYEKIYVHPPHHAGYYPGAQPMSLKLLFDPESGQVLGAQAVGGDGVDKRIDVLAVAVQARMTVYDLEETELAYAPPFGSPKDPVNMAGFVAAGVLRGDHPVAHADQLSDSGSQDAVVLDVRTAQEHAAGTIPGAMLIPLHELRDRIDEIPRGRRVLVFCKVGFRGYLATRILLQRGYQAANLSGGYTTYLHVCGPYPGERPA